MDFSINSSDSSESESYDTSFDSEATNSRPQPDPSVLLFDPPIKMSNLPESIKEVQNPPPLNIITYNRDSENSVEIQKMGPGLNLKNNSINDPTKIQEKNIKDEKILPQPKIKVPVYNLAKNEVPIESSFSAPKPSLVPKNIYMPESPGNVPKNNYIPKSPGNPYKPHDDIVKTSIKNSDENFEKNLTSNDSLSSIDSKPSIIVKPTDKFAFPISNSKNPVPPPKPPVLISQKYEDNKLNPPSNNWNKLSLSSATSSDSSSSYNDEIDGVSAINKNIAGISDPSQIYSQINSVNPRNEINNPEKSLNPEPQVKNSSNDYNAPLKFKFIDQTNFSGPKKIELLNQSPKFEIIPKSPKVDENDIVILDESSSSSVREVKKNIPISNAPEVKKTIPIRKVTFTHPFVDPIPEKAANNIPAESESEIIYESSFPKTDEINSNIPLGPSYIKTQEFLYMAKLLTYNQIINEIKKFSFIAESLWIKPGWFNPICGCLRSPQELTQSTSQNLLKLISLGNSNFDNNNQLHKDIVKTYHMKLTNKVQFTNDAPTWKMLGFNDEKIESNEISQIRILVTILHLIFLLEYAPNVLNKLTSQAFGNRSFGLIGVCQNLIRSSLDMLKRQELNQIMIEDGNDPITTFFKFHTAIVMVCIDLYSDRKSIEDSIKIAVKKGRSNPNQMLEIFHT